MIDKVFAGLTLVLEYINSVPGHSWFVLGSLITASGLTFIIVNVVRNHHLRKKGEQLSKQLVQLNLAFWGLITSAASFLVTHGTDITALSSFAPFMKEYIAPVMVVSTYIYHFGGNGIYKAAVAKLHEWAGKKVLEYEKPVVAPERTVPANTGSDMFS